jgi:glycosyltransferase involved in cell wall biosynthesis
MKGCREFTHAGAGVSTAANGTARLDAHNHGMTPRVSIVLPTRNRAGELREAVESVFRQTFASWECLVVDDGSSDGTPEIAGELALADRRVRTIRRDPGGSHGAARNAGLAAARGDLVAFLDDDDRWLPEKLALQIRILEQDLEAAMLFGRVELFGDAEGVWPRRLALTRPTVRELLASNFVPVSTVVARRSAVERAGGFDANLPVAEDYDLWIRIALTSPLRGDDAVVARYRFDAARFERQRGDQIAALDAIVSRLGASREVPAGWLRPARRRIHRHRARTARGWRERLSEWRKAIV